MKNFLDSIFRRLSHFTLFLILAMMTSALFCLSMAVACPVGPLKVLLKEKKDVKVLTYWSFPLEFELEGLATTDSPPHLVQIQNARGEDFLSHVQMKETEKKALVAAHRKKAKEHDHDHAHIQAVNRTELQFIPGNLDAGAFYMEFPVKIQFKDSKDKSYFVEIEINKNSVDSKGKCQFNPKVSYLEQLE